MKTKNRLLEMEFQKGLRLSGLWHTIYHEGIRGHHIMFEQEVVKAAEKQSHLQSHPDSLTHAVVDVMSQPTLDGIKQSLGHYDQPIKSDIYRLYKRALTRWQGSRIAKLN